MSEQSRIETAIGATLDNCELFRAQIAEQARVIASLRQHKNEYMDAAEVTRKALLAEIAALKAQSSGVEMPTHEHLQVMLDCLSDSANRDDALFGWSECIDFIARLNSSPVSGCGVDERAAFDEWFCKRHSYKPGTDTTQLSAAFEPFKAWQARSQLAAPTPAPVEPAHSDVSVPRESEEDNSCPECFGACEDHCGPCRQCGGEGTFDAALRLSGSRALLNGGRE